MRLNCKRNSLVYFQSSKSVTTCKCWIITQLCITTQCLTLLTPNDPYSGRTAPLTSKRCISCIYSTNIGTEYFKHGIYSSFFYLQNAVCFIILTYLVPVLFTFYIQGVLKLKKKNSGAKRLMVATVIALQIQVFWDLKPCWFVNSYPQMFTNLFPAII